MKCEGGTLREHESRWSRLSRGLAFPCSSSLMSGWEHPIWSASSLWLIPNSTRRSRTLSDRNFNIGDVVVVAFMKR